jgi:RNA polymerase sigma-70 factor (ECF subfamily)
MANLHDDRAWLAAFRAGDHRALERVYRAHVNEVAQLLRRGFSFQNREGTYRFRGYRSEFDLENALQEVFLRAFSERARLAYDGLRPYGAYLVAIARNVVIDEFRRLAKDAETFAAEHEEHLPAPAPDLEAEELGRLLVRTLEGLEPRERELYEIRFARGLSQRDAARALGLTRIQVRRRENHLKRRLLEVLRGGGYAEGVRDVPRVGARTGRPPIDDGVGP